MMESIYNKFRLYPHISTDTRNIIQGSIFFALRGASFDGNDFALEALSQGAAYAVVDRASLAQSDERLIFVEDVLITLQHLATYHRQELGIPIIAITGSNGKTTTKELLTAVLSQRFRTSATVGNLNNHIGVPLTLLSMNTSTEIGVVEMGANARGEIAALCKIAEPNYGIVNNIGRAHLEGFGGEDGVRCGKGELYDYLNQSGGVAFVAQDDKVLMAMAAEREGLERVEYPYILARGIRHHLEGEYNLKNIASAVAIATYFRVERGDIESAIYDYMPQNNRSQRLVTSHNTLVIDCYNANPSSMEVSIKNFLNEDFAMPKVLILGDMFELGEWSDEEHKRVIRQALSVAESTVILVGKNFAKVYSKLDISASNISLFPTRTELEEYLYTTPVRGAAILIKGSRGIGLECVVTML